MANMESPDSYPAYYSKLSSNLFNHEKCLIKLLEGLPIEKQNHFTKQIENLGKDRHSFISATKSQPSFNPEDSIKSIADLQEASIACLSSMIGELVQDSSTVDYKETENLFPVLKRRSSSAKGMIVGNFNEVIESMDRIIGVGENLIVHGYQKLFIDSLSVKNKLQIVIDERQTLPVCEKPIDTLVAKQNYCEKQLRCLLMLLEEANTLTDLITKLQEFDKRQIQFQQASQVTTDAMKKFFYKPEIRKTNERRRTYLSVSYADPSNPREGLDILRDQLNSVIRNLNNLCDMEDAKVRTVKRSDIGDECEKAFEEALQDFEEEKEVVKKTLSVLASIEDNQVELDRCDAFIENFKLPQDTPQSQLDFIKYFVQLGLLTPKLRLQQSKLVHDLVQRFDQDHSTYSSLVDKLQSEISELLHENAQLKVQAQGAVIGKVSEGSRSVKELIELQEHLKNTIQESLENQIRHELKSAVLVSSAVADILLDINPDEDLKRRVFEYDNEFSATCSLSRLTELLNKYQGWNFRLVCKLGRLSDAQIHSNLLNIKQAKTLKAAREGINGKPSEYPLAAMDRVLSEILKSYLASLDDGKGNIESVLQKQAILTRLLKD